MPARIEGDEKLFKKLIEVDMDENRDADPLRGPGRWLTSTDFEVMRKTSTPRLERSRAGVRSFISKCLASRR
ncbi:hypothetical protein AKJ41_04895 [candidate division MSBL1 archaeon SCGC-AAA259O05]|uniref:Uncharacterized protein n=2 Tax=candidate division MSBL1 TaxID=215777 RepID=A0A133V056_9EURY|nr:hypothetical protein AKJ57_03350 [candidate division MSBL1 archaeon SCGC-AAA259A05]KXA99803.1 hypothetical protein AKJ41_04895 [candidate division MSBL1 archaeon SCGC-AAA259O05]